MAYCKICGKESETDKPHPNCATTTEVHNGEQLEAKLASTQDSTVITGSINGQTKVAFIDGKIDGKTIADLIWED